MEIPQRPWMRWESSYKNYTKNCLQCEWYRKIDDQELCGWGVAFKYLVKSEKLRTCEIKNRKDKPNYPSIKYLDELIKNAMD